MNNRYFTVSKKIKREFSQMFSMNEPNFEKYVNSDSKQAKSYIKLLHQIESFRIGSYEFTGGMQPRIFVRINDPFKLRLITTDFSYKNNILDDINNRYESSIKIMDYFFTENLSDDERWDFIENYFLGKNVEEEIN